jgi:spermidine synthase
VATLLVPTIAIGGTFPLAVRWLEGRPGHHGGRTGWIYAANTAGAALGAGLAGFVWLPRLGLADTTWVGITLNAAAAGGALLLAAGFVPDAEAPAGTTAGAAATAARPKPGSAVFRPRFWLPALAVTASGGLALAFEVAWTRLLVLVLGPTTYAFSLMLVAFILGIALGSGAAACLVPRLAAGQTLALGAALVLGGLGATAAALAVPGLPLLVAALTTAPDASFASVLVRQAGLLVLLLVPMAASLGAVLPFGLGAVSAGRAEAADRVAALYTLNTLGAIVGALASGFVVMPLAGLRATIAVCAGLAVLAGALLVALATESAFRLRAVWGGVAVMTLFLTAMLPEFDPKLLSSGPYKYADLQTAPDLQTGLEAGTLLYYEEGLAGTVSVRRVAGTTSLAINGKVDASNGADMLTQKLLAHVPLLLHPSPRDVAILGLGSGVTLGSALRHPVSSVDMLEISPEVVEASSFFAAENHGALSDQRARLILGDGRTHLSLASRRYDVIVSEPSNPWMAGIAMLFTREVFESARDRLKPGGLFCQWAHTYDIAGDDLRSIVATFHAVFPEGSLWLVGEGDLLLIGSTGPIEPMLETLVREWVRPGVAADLAEIEVRDRFSVLSAWLGGPSLLASYAEGAFIQTDDWPRLEFSAPRAIFGRARDDNVGRLRSLAALASRPDVIATLEAEATAETWRGRAAMYARAGAHQAAYDDYRRAIELEPADAEALRGLVEAAQTLGRTFDVGDLLARLLAADPANVPVAIEASRLQAALGRVDEALATVAAVAERAAGDARPTVQRAAILADAGRTDELAAVVASLEQQASASADTAYFAASLAFLRGDYVAALQSGERALAARPDDARTLNLLGAAYATLGDRDRARGYFQASLKSDPRDATSYTNLGMFELNAANADVAAGLFAEALTLDPHAEAARQGLIEALRVLGDDERVGRLLATADGDR